MILSWVADGKELSQVVIEFKRKTTPKISFPVGDFSHAHEKGWMNEEGIKLWLDNIWSRQLRGLQKQLSLFAWVMLKHVMTEDTEKHLAGNNPNMVVIP
jgi:hypothetical protein